jgi:hypothetical protein
MTNRPTSAATYVFCLVQSARSPSLRGVPESVPGAGPARMLLIERDLWAVVADAPLDRFSSERLEQDLQDLEAVSRHAVAHAAVVEFFFRKFPVIPLKLFTLFSEDERVAAQLASRSRALRKLFVRLRGREEWGVRITVDPLSSDRSTSRPLVSGRDYLAIKKRLLDESGAPTPAAVKEARGALASLRRMATDARKETFPAPGRNRPFVIGASFLVLAKKRAAWTTQAAKLAAALATHGHRLELTGPWPPYHFASTGK